MLKRWGIPLTAMIIASMANVALAVEEAGGATASTQGLGNGVAVFGIAAVIAVAAYMLHRAGKGES